MRYGTYVSQAFVVGMSIAYDRQVVHDGFKNRYSFEHHGHKVIPTPLSSKEVYLKQLRMKESSKRYLRSEETEKQGKREEFERRK